jgi:CelD/BcsL family acetyltransferase involved in cellulose biosynthesis
MAWRNVTLMTTLVRHDPDTTRVVRREVTLDHTPIRIQEIHDLDSWIQLEPAWNVLLGNSDGCCVYLTFEWLHTWWECLGRDRANLFVLVMSEREQPIAIAPLMIVERCWFGIPFRSIEFISSSEYADAPGNCSGTLDFIVAKGRENLVSGMLRHLVTSQVQWDYVRLTPVPRSSKSISEIQDVCFQLNIPFWQRHVFTQSHIDIHEGWEPYYSARPREFRKKLRNRENRLRRKAEPTYREIRSIAQLPGGFDTILDIERASWKWNTGVSINSMAYNDFYRRLAEVAGTKGWLRLWMLEVDGNAIAYDYHIAFNGTIESLKGSYREEFAEYSPGLLLSRHENEQFCGEGVNRINLLWGDVHDKRRWATSMAAYDELYLFNTGIKPKLLHFLLSNVGVLHVRRRITDLRRRLMRKLGIRDRSSELTRADQLADMDESDSDSKQSGNDHERSS